MKMCYINSVMKNENKKMKKTIDNEMKMCYINNMKNENKKMKKMKKTIDNKTKICYINNMKNWEKILIYFEFGMLFAAAVLIIINL